MLGNLNIELWDIINIVTGTIDWIIFFSVIQIVGKRRIYGIIRQLSG